VSFKPKEIKKEGTAAAHNSERVGGPRQSKRKLTEQNFRAEEEKKRRPDENRGKSQLNEKRAKGIGHMQNTKCQRGGEKVFRFFKQKSESADRTIWNTLRGRGETVNLK